LKVCSKPKDKVSAADVAPKDSAGLDAAPALPQAERVLPVLPIPVLTSELVASGYAVRVSANVLCRWERIAGGELYASTSRVDWAVLLRRTFQVDVKQCPECDGRLQPRATITDPASVQKILTALKGGCGPRAPPRAA
jgi:hypothetical protein